MVFAILSVHRGGTLIYLKGSLINQIFVSMLRPGGTVGVAVFFLISGYFLIKKEGASIRKVLIETLLYGIVCGVISSVLKLLDVADYVSWWTITTSILVPVTSSNIYWFIPAYIILVMLVPFLNKRLKALSDKSYFNLLIILWIFTYTFDILLEGKYTGLEKGIFYYCTGGYIRLYKNEKIGTSKQFVILSAFLLTWTFYGYLFYVMENGISLMGFNIPMRLLDAMGESVLTLLCGVFIFILFKSFNIRSQIINKLAATTLSMYLISDNPALRMFIWENIWHVQYLYLSGSFFAIKGVLIILATCFACSLVDGARILIENRLVSKTYL